ncbi:hypothetical protein V2W30_41335 (plasmid) [Streptomyces sp. Q6]|uniref:Uncharacterized protein n=1 Tax=Streptomyces citrinus TaxID=3118173 RepID=A0ACD5AQZ5_9ACTN
MDALAELDRRHHDLTDQIGYWQHVIAAAEDGSAKIWRPADFTAGDFARVGGRWVEVLRVNTKSLAVSVCVERRPIVTTDHATSTGRVPYDNVTGRATPDEITRLTAPKKG